MTTRNTPAMPRRDTEAAGETDPFSPRARGRHRKPRPRKALLAAGGLALAAGALSLVRLSSGPGTDSVGTVEAEPRPDPVTTGTDEATNAAATVPEASPSSPTALGGLTPSPGTHRPAAASPAPSTSTSVAIDTRGADTAATPRSTAVSDTTNPPAPTAGGEAPRPAPAPPSPPSRATPAPAPDPEKPEKPQDPGLCVPVIDLCLDPPG